MLTALAREDANDRIHYRLKNWGAFQRANADDGPADNPVPAEWQSQITDDNVWPPEELADTYIDECDAERIQHALILCSERDNVVAMILRRHYYYRMTSSGVHIAINKFWRYLIW